MGIPDTVSSALRKLMPHWKGEPSACSYLSGGYSNANYRISYQGQHYVLRLPTNDGPFEGAANEVRLRKLLPDRSLEVAPMVAELAPQGLLLTGFCDGALMASRPPAMDTASQYLSHLCNRLAGIKAVEPYPLGQLVDSWLPEPEAWLEPWLRAEPHWETQSRATQCCHNDLNPWNVIAANSDVKGWITLDWETAMANDPLFDVVTLYEGLCALPGYQANMTLADVAEFALGSRFTSGRLHQTTCWFWLREYAWASNQQRHGNTNPAVAAQVQEAKNQLRALVS